MTTTTTRTSDSEGINSTKSIGSNEIGKENAAGNDTASVCTKQGSNAKWSILRNAIVTKSSTLTARSSKTVGVEGSIHRFAGFNLMRRERLPRDQVLYLQRLLTTIVLNVGEDLVSALELSLLALTALLPSQWSWEFAVTFQSEADMNNWCSQELMDLLEHRLQNSSENPKHRIRLGQGTTWLQSNDSSTTLVLKVALAPFVPSCGIFRYKLPHFQEADGPTANPSNGCDASSFLYTRERLGTTRTSLQELVSHHRHEGLDNTGNICVWDSEKTLAYCLLKHFASHKLLWFLPTDQRMSSIDILELGAGMAGLAGLSLAQIIQQTDPGRQFRLWLTDGHPQAAQNNAVHAHLMHLQLQTSGPNPIKCTTLPWSIDHPHRASQDHPPPCHIMLVSDCTHFQSFHAHLFFTLAYGVRVNGCIYMCQPHRGKSLQRFLDIVQVTSIREQGKDIPPLFAMEWLEIPELAKFNSDVVGNTSKAHYDPNIHCPCWLVLRKLRDVEEQDRLLVMMHMATRDDPC